MDTGGREAAESIRFDRSRWEYGRKLAALVALVGCAATAGALAGKSSAEGKGRSCVKRPLIYRFFARQMMHYDRDKWVPDYGLALNTEGGPVHVDFYENAGGHSPFEKTDEQELTPVGLAQTGSLTQSYDHPPNDSFNALVRVTSACGTDVRAIKVKTPPPEPVVPFDGCQHYEVIDAHGSSEGANEISPPGQHFYKEFRNRVGYENVNIKAMPFPAAGGLKVLAGAVLKLPADYYKSVKRSELWLWGAIDSWQEKCTGEIVLTGYSQGAQAVGDVLQRNIGPWAYAGIKGAVLFGDPYFNHEDPLDRFGWNRGSSGDSQTYHNGFLGARPVFNFDQVISYCHKGDPVCQGPTQALHLMHEHDNYDKYGEGEAAADYLASRG